MPRAYYIIMDHRAKVYTTLDEEKIRQSLAKDGVRLPMDLEMDSFWGGVHKGILLLPYITEKERRRSINWLMEHSFVFDGDGRMLEDLKKQLENPPRGEGPEV